MAKSRVIQLAALSLFIARLAVGQTAEDPALLARARSAAGRGAPDRHAQRPAVDAAREVPGRPDEGGSRGRPDAALRGRAPPGRGRRRRAVLGGLRRVLDDVDAHRAARGPARVRRGAALHPQPAPTRAGALRRRHRPDPPSGPHRLAHRRRGRAHDRAVSGGPARLLRPGRALHDADPLGQRRVGGLRDGPARARRADQAGGEHRPRDEPARNVRRHLARQRRHHARRPARDARARDLLPLERPRRRRPSAQRSRRRPARARGQRRGDPRQLHRGLRGARP